MGLAWLKCCGKGLRFYNFAEPEVLGIEALRVYRPSRVARPMGSKFVRGGLRFPVKL